IQYNKRDLPNILSVEQLNRTLNERNVPWFEAIAIQSVGVVETFKAICAAVVTKLNEDLHARL
ncbi:MAG: gliding-motility protein MglA, partial [Candidatus Sumerlaeaceae bacterium]